MEFLDWNEFITPAEKQAANILKDGKTPENVYPASKLLELPESTNAAKDVEALFPATEPEYDGKKARVKKEKEDSEFGTPGKQ